MRLKSSIKKSIKKYSIKRAVAHCVVGLFFKQDSKHTKSKTGSNGCERGGSGLTSVIAVRESGQIEPFNS